MQHYTEQNYKNLMPYVNGIQIGQARHFQSDGFMDLIIEGLYRSDDGGFVISMSHYGEQNGDMMADPDMEIKLYPKMTKASGLEIPAHAEAMTFQNDYMGMYQEVYPEPGKYIPKLRDELNSFLHQWLSNIKTQGYVIAPAKVDADIA